MRKLATFHIWLHSIISLFFTISAIEISSHLIGGGYNEFYILISVIFGTFFSPIFSDFVVKVILKTDFGKRKIYGQNYVGSSYWLFDAVTPDQVQNAKEGSIILGIPAIVQFEFEENGRIVPKFMRHPDDERRLGWHYRQSEQSQIYGKGFYFNRASVYFEENMNEIVAWGQFYARIPGGSQEYSRYFGSVMVPGEALVWRQRGQMIDKDKLKELINEHGEEDWIDYCLKNPMKIFQDYHAFRRFF